MLCRCLYCHTWHRQGDEMTDAQIKCINKREHHNPHERITHIGGYPAEGGGNWKWTLEHAIDEIEAGRWRFYVSVGGQSVWVIVAIRNGRKYLKTQNDGDEPNNLLSLPECP
ncbi:DUF3892 domain-containing protein [Lysobacter yananisis]